MHIHAWHKKWLPFQPWTIISLECQRAVFCAGNHHAATQNPAKNDKCTMFVRDQTQIMLNDQL
jgi:hypothetical protein